MLNLIWNNENCCPQIVLIKAVHHEIYIFHYVLPFSHDAQAAQVAHVNSWKVHTVWGLMHPINIQLTDCWTVHFWCNSLKTATKTTRLTSKAILSLTQGMPGVFSHWGFIDSDIHPYSSTDLWWIPCLFWMHLEGGMFVKAIKTTIKITKTYLRNIDSYACQLFYLITKETQHKKYGRKMFWS